MLTGHLLAQLNRYITLLLQNEGMHGQLTALTGIIEAGTIKTRQ